MSTFIETILSKKDIKYINESINLHKILYLSNVDLAKYIIELNSKIEDTLNNINSLDVVVNLSNYNLDSGRVLLPKLELIKPIPVDPLPSKEALNELLYSLKVNFLGYEISPSNWKTYKCTSCNVSGVKLYTSVYTHCPPYYYCRSCLESKEFKLKPLFNCDFVFERVPEDKDPLLYQPAILPEIEQDENISIFDITINQLAWWNNLPDTKETPDGRS